MKTDPSDFIDDLAEALELKLLGFDTVGSKSWADHAFSLLTDYHLAVNKTEAPNMPLWRSLHRAYSSQPESSPPCVLFSKVIAALCARIEVDFPLRDIDKSMLIGFLMDESEKALACSDEFT